MSAKVYSTLRTASAAGVLNGRVIRSPQLTSLVQLANTVLGQGAVLVPAYNPGVTITKTTSGVLRFRVRQRNQSRARVWGFVVRRASGGTSFDEVSAEAPVGGTAIDIPVLTHGAYPPAEIVEKHSATPSEAEIAIQFTSINEDFDVLSLACYELPRHSLGTLNNDYGTDEQRVSAEAILTADGAGVDELLNRIGEGLDRTIDVGRRVGQFMWAAPDDTSLAFSATGVTASLFALNPPVLGRALDLDNGTGEAATVNQVGCRVRGKVSSGGTAGQYDVSMTSGDGGSIAITSTTWAWHPDPASFDALHFDIDSEDITTADGRRSSRWDEIAQTLTRTSGSGTVYVNAISIWEED